MSLTLPKRDDDSYTEFEWLESKSARNFIPKCFRGDWTKSHHVVMVDNCWKDMMKTPNSKYRLRASGMKTMPRCIRTYKRKEDPVISKHILSSGERFEAVYKFFEKIGPLVQTIGMMFEALDPVKYSEYIANYEHWVQHSPFKVLKVSARACFLCLALLRNATVGRHKDTTDVKDGWAAMCCFGKWTGGELVVPELGVKVPYGEGDVVFFRAPMFEHALLPFVGKRSSFVFFTKASTWLSVEEIKAMSVEASLEEIFEEFGLGE